jgi:hypothetical protein
MAPDRHRAPASSAAVVRGGIVAVGRKDAIDDEAGLDDHRRTAFL